MAVKEISHREECSSGLRGRCYERYWLTKHNLDKHDSYGPYLTSSASLTAW
jgi:hypothetical protein